MTLPLLMLFSIKKSDSLIPMKMKNQIFDSSRCLAYLKKYVTDNRNSLLVKAGVLLLVPLVMCIAWPYFFTGCYIPHLQYPPLMKGIDPMWMQETTLYCFLWVITTCWTSLFFIELRRKEDRISLFTNPASNFEKFVVNFFIYVIAFQLLYVFFWIFADAMRVWIMRAVYSTSHNVTIDYIPLSYLLSFGETNIFEASSPASASIGLNGWISFCTTLYVGLGLQAMFALGATVWPKNNALKTVCFLIAFMILAGTLFSWGVLLFHSHYRPESSWIGSSSHRLLFSNIIMGCCIVYIWCLVYFRFKEWEVIKRW